MSFCVGPYWLLGCPDITIMVKLSKISTSSICNGWKQTRNCELWALLQAVYLFSLFTGHGLAEPPGPAECCQSSESSGAPWDSLLPAGDVCWRWVWWTFALDYDKGNCMNQPYWRNITFFVETCCSLSIVLLFPAFCDNRVVFYVRAWIMYMCACTHTHTLTCTYARTHTHTKHAHTLTELMHLAFATLFDKSSTCPVPVCCLLCLSLLRGVAWWNLLMHW